MVKLYGVEPQAPNSARTPRVPQPPATPRAAFTSPRRTHLQRKADVPRTGPAGAGAYSLLTADLITAHMPQLFQKPDSTQLRQPSFLEQLRVSPRKPRKAAALPALSPRGRAVATMPDDAGEVRRSGSPDGSKTGSMDEASDSVRDEEPVELMRDLRWILFPATNANQPQDLPLSASQLEPADHAHSELLQTLRKARLFQRLPDDLLRQLLLRGRQRSFPRYSSLVREGSKGGTCYVVLQGQCASISTRHASGTLLGRGAVIGEGAFVTSELWRDASVSVVSPTARLLLLTYEAVADAHQLMDTLRASPELAEVKRDVVTTCMARLPFFGTLPSKKLEQLASLMEFCHYQPGTVVFREGDAGNKFYIFVDGLVKVVKSVRGSSEQKLLAVALLVAAEQRLVRRRNASRVCVAAAAARPRVAGSGADGGEGARAH